MISGKPVGEPATPASRGVFVLSMRLLIAFVGCCGLANSPAHSFWLCTKPSKPRCIDLMWTFEDTFSFDSCRQEIKRYRDAVEAYLSCLEQEADTTANELKEVIRRFNCKAKGGMFCF